jgi:tight adherence protein C
MFLFFTLIGFLGVAWSLYHLDLARAGHRNFWLPWGIKSISFFTDNTKKSPLRFITHFKFLCEPGWVLRNTTDLSEKKIQIIRAQEPFSFLEYVALKNALVLLSFLGAWIFFFFGSVSLAGISQFVFVVLFFYFLPDLLLRSRIEKNQLRLKKQILYFIDLVTFTLETGMNLEQVLGFVSREKNTYLDQRIQWHLSSMRMGKTLDQILEDLKKEIDMPIFDSFVLSIVQAQKLGVSLAQTLKIQSELIQTRRRQAAEELSRTAAVKMSIPLVFFIFPALLILYIGPGVLRLLG